MAVFMNAKGTTNASFQIGKRGGKVFGGVSTPSPSVTSSGDLWIDSSNSVVKVAEVSGNTVTWASIITTNSSPELDNLTVSGNLTVQGTTTTINTQTLNVEDNIITLNSNFTGADNIVDGGIEIERGDETNVSFLWDESEGEWTLGSEQIVAGGFIGNLHGNVVGSIAPNGVPNTLTGNTINAGDLNVTGTVDVSEATISSNIDMNNNSILGVDTLRINENGTGLRMTNVGAFDNSGGDFRVFSNGNLILSTNGDSGTAVTFDADTKDATFQGNIVANGLTFPTADGTADQVLVTDGNGTLSFATVNANPGGSNTQIQFNNDGSFDGSSAFTFDDSTDTLSTGVIKSISFEQFTDYDLISGTPAVESDFGSILSSTSAKIDQGLIVTDSGLPILPSYDVANLPTGVQAGTFLFCPNEAGGATIVFYDGANWRRPSDNGIAS